MKLPFLSLTSKIVLLVATMGAVGIILMGHAAWQAQQAETKYHQLLAQQAITANQIWIAQQHLDDAATLIQGAYSSTDKQQLIKNKEQLKQLQKAFEANLAQIHTQRPDDAFAHQLDHVLTQSRDMFVSSRHTLKALLRADSSNSLQTPSSDWTLAQKNIKNEMNTLRADAQKVFEIEVQNIASHTDQSMTQTTLAGWLIFLLMTAGTAWITRRHISAPMRRLTASMQHLQQSDFSLTIADQHRGDEIGDMALALQRFATSLEEAKHVATQQAQHQRSELLAEQWQQLSNALPGAVFQMQLRPGESLKLRFVSPQWAQLMGMPADTDTGVHNAAHTLLTHDHNVVAISEKHYRESAKTLKPVDFSISMVMVDGVTRWIKSRANPYREIDGTITFNGVWLDVTKEMMQSRALEKAKRQAEQSASERSFLQASISHEIRTPLNAILGLTQLLLKADLPPAQREQIHHILRAGHHLRGIVNEVLDFSKIDAGQLKLESTDFSLENVVLDVLGMCNEEASKKGLSINYKMAREVPDSLRGDPHRIAQILLNYVNNAIKFTTSGDIHIALQLDHSSTLHRIVLHVSVKDTGPGIPSDRLPQLFEAFQQADNSITRRFGGTGLGLTISRALAQLMGGSTGVHSIVGQGSTFWFTAVLEPARTPVLRAALQTLTPQTHTLPDAWKGLRVLVVDDNPLNRAVAEGMLHALGLQTEIAEDGAQALLKLQTTGPAYFDCVLMDIQMPHMDGLSATQAIRQLPGFSSLPIIAMTAHTAVQDVERAQAAGMNAHLSKPLLESALHHVLQEWLCRPTSTPTSHGAVDTDTPPHFDPMAIDALAQLFDNAKLRQLVSQFTQDSLQRALQLPILAEQHDWQGMRAEVHKLTGTAATFGLMQLGHLSSELSTALKASDSERAHHLAEQVTQSAQEGVAQLEAYCLTLFSNA